jgi:hypothetical protein
MAIQIRGLLTGTLELDSYISGASSEQAAIGRTVRRRERAGIHGLAFFLRSAADYNHPSAHRPSGNTPLEGLRMIVARHRRYPLTIANVYFAQSISSVSDDVDGADLIYYYHSRQPVEGSREFRTLHIDLRADEAALLAGMAKGTRYKVRRAEDRDGLNASLIRYPSEEDLRKFCEFYDVFARMRGLQPSSPARLSALRLSNGLFLSSIEGPDRQVLCWHAYVVDGERALLLHSASHFRAVNESSERNLAGRANRYLHWLEIRSFRELGFSTFDFGGLAAGTGGGELDGVDEFKRGFGGVEVVEYNYTQARSLAGKLRLQLQALKERHSTGRRRIG